MAAPFPYSTGKDGWMIRQPMAPEQSHLNARQPRTALSPQQGRYRPLTTVLVPPLDAPQFATQPHGKKTEDMDIVLENPRHEIFAQALASGQSAQNAYAAAGYKPNRGNAARLKAEESIRGRVKALQAQASAAENVTRERLIEMCMEVFEQAAEAGNAHSAQIAAIREIGVLTGLRVEKRDEPRKPPEMTKEQRDAATAAALMAARHDQRNV